MALRTEMKNLESQLESLAEAFSNLRRLLDDHPSDNDALLLLDSFGDAVEDLLGWLEEAFQALKSLPLSKALDTGNEFDVNHAGQVLGVAQEIFNRQLNRFFLDLVCHDRIAQLLHLGRERGGEWKGWSTGIKMEIETCRHHLCLTNEALSRCWIELTEWIGMNSVSVRTTNVGQQIAVPSRRSSPAAT